MQVMRKMKEYKENLIIQIEYKKYGRLTEYHYSKFYFSKIFLHSSFFLG